MKILMMDILIVLKDHGTSEVDLHIVTLGKQEIRVTVSLSLSISRRKALVPLQMLTVTVEVILTLSTTLIMASSSTRKEARTMKDV